MTGVDLELIVFLVYFNALSHPQTFEPCIRHLLPILTVQSFGSHISILDWPVWVVNFSYYFQKVGIISSNFVACLVAENARIASH